MCILPFKGNDRIPSESNDHLCIRNFYLFCPKYVKSGPKFFVRKLLSEFLKSEIFRS